jgi:glyceraldehyde-3-phosphate dehydrogenase/erythrose-4-phosphate dehydrogenase
VSTVAVAAAAVAVSTVAVAAAAVAVSTVAAAAAAAAAVALSTIVQLDYAGLGVQQVWECTGAFLTRAALQPYFEKGVPKVVVSAPVKDALPVLNIVMGCNHVSCCCQLTP